MLPAVIGVLLLPHTVTLMMSLSDLLLGIRCDAHVDNGLICNNPYSLLIAWACLTLA